MMKCIILFVVVLSLLSFPALSQSKFKSSSIDGNSDHLVNQAISPSIAVSRKDPKNIIITGFNDRTYVSKDSGATWTKGTLNSLAGNTGDMNVLSDRKGNFTILHLPDSTNGRKHNRIVCQQSKDGFIWDEGHFAGVDLVDGNDYYQPKATMHPQTSALYLTWTAFTKYGSDDPAHKSNIIFSQSKDGDKWSKPIQINNQTGSCADNNKMVIGATPVVSFDGKIAVVWSWNEKIYMDRSYNKGDTWLTNDLEVTDQPGGWAMSIPGLSHCSGIPVARVDNGYGHFHGSLYITWADQRNGAEDTDIWFMRSSNFGDHWTQPIRIGETTPKKHQFLPSMAVDHSTGYIYIVYYDQSKYDDLHTDLVLSFSVDGGATFKNVTINENFYVPDQKAFYDKYIHIDAYQGLITPVWIQLDNDKPGIWMSVIKQQELEKK